MGMCCFWSKFDVDLVLCNGDWKVNFVTAFAPVFVWQMIRMNVRTKKKRQSCAILVLAAYFLYDLPFFQDETQRLNVLGQYRQIFERHFYFKWRTFVKK